MHTPRKNSTRMVRCICTVCGFLFRAARAHIAKAPDGLWCPSCRGEVEVQP